MSLFGPIAKAPRVLCVSGMVLDNSSDNAICFLGRRQAKRRAARLI